MYKTVMAALALLLVACGPVFAQQQRAEELLRWFPQGNYMMIMHKDSAQLSLGKAWPLFQEFFEPKAEETDTAKSSGRAKAGKEGPRTAARVSMLRGPGMHQLALTPILRAAVQSSTIADALELADAPPAPGEDPPHFVVEMPDSPKREGGDQEMSVGFFITRNLSLEAHRLLDPEMAIEAALKAGEIAATGRNLSGRPIYSFQAARFGDRSEDRFAWLSLEGELLVAGTPELLRKMVATGRGEMLGIVDDVDYSDLVQVIPDLGAYWSALSLGRTGARMAEMSENISDEQLQRMQDRATSGPQFEVSSWAVGDEILNREITVFADAESAEKFQGRERGGFPGGMDIGPEYTAYQQLLAQRRQTEVDGHLVIKTMIYDRDLFEAEQKANEAMAAALARNNGRLEFTSPDGGKQIVIEMKREDPKGGNIKKKQ